MSRAKVSENNKTIVFWCSPFSFYYFFLSSIFTSAKVFGTKSRLQQTVELLGTDDKICLFFSSSQTDVDHSKQDTTCKLNRFIQQ